MTISLTSSDQIILDGAQGPYLFTGLATKEVGSLEFTDDILKFERGKDGNTIISENQPGYVGKLKLRVLRGTPDFNYLNTERITYSQNPSAYVLMDLSIVKNLGDGAGNTIRDTYNATNGAISKLPKMSVQVAGETEQAIAEFELMFSGALEIISG